jgi:hypothetical protein
MRKHDRIVVELSIDILRAAVDRADDACVGTDAVRLALRCLLAHCPERWPLTSFWDPAGADGHSRRANLAASFNGIIHELRQSGAYDGALI